MQMKQLRKYKLFLSQNKALMEILFKQVLKFFFRCKYLVKCVIIPMRTEQFYEVIIVLHAQCVVVVLFKVAALVFNWKRQFCCSHL